MTLADTSATIQELEAEIQRDLGHRYTFRRMLAATDRALWLLEHLNAHLVVTMSDDERRAVRQRLAGLPAFASEAFVDSDDVQKVLDSVFEVQERLFRWRDPGREVETGPDYTAADLIRWVDTCRWLESIEEGLLRSLAPQDRFADLEALHAHRVVFIRDNTRWRVYGDWPARLERMRVRLEAGSDE